MRILILTLLLTGCVNNEQRTQSDTTAWQRFCFICTEWKATNEVHNHHQKTQDISATEAVTDALQTPAKSEEPGEPQAVEIPTIAPHLQEFDTGDGCSKETPEYCL